MGTVTMVIIMNCVTMMVVTVVGKMLIHFTALNAFSLYLIFPPGNSHNPGDFSFGPLLPIRYLLPSWIIAPITVVVKTTVLV